MMLKRLFHWLQTAVGSTGGLGLLLVAFLDSSVLTFPVINDLLVVSLSIANPARMPYYALMATLGSVAGCVFLYYLARKGGEIMFHEHAGPRAAHIRAWVLRNGFLAVLIPALLPPPMPLKPFVIGAGVFEVPLRIFTLALVLARTLRYFLVGFLALRYGPSAIDHFAQHKLDFALIALGVVLLGYLLSRIFLRYAHPRS